MREQASIYSWKTWSFVERITIYAPMGFYHVSEMGIQIVIVRQVSHNICWRTSSSFKWDFRRLYFATWTIKFIGRISRHKNFYNDI